MRRVQYAANASDNQDEPSIHIDRQHLHLARMQPASQAKRNETARAPSQLPFASCKTARKQRASAWRNAPASACGPRVHLTRECRRVMTSTCSAGGSFMRITAAHALSVIVVQRLTWQWQDFAPFAASEGDGGQALDGRCAARARKARSPGHTAPSCRMMCPCC